MNCDNREYMFGRDLVGCVMRKLCPDWEDPNFHFGEKEGSPFTKYLNDAVQFIVQERYSHYAVRLRGETECQPLTIKTYCNIMQDKWNKLILEKPGDQQRQLDLFLYVAAGANFFFERGQPGVCVVAADMIARYIFLLKMKGYFDESTWEEYEDEIDHLTNIVED